MNTFWFDSYNRMVPAYLKYHPYTPCSRNIFAARCLAADFSKSIFTSISQRVDVIHCMNVQRFCYPGLPWQRPLTRRAVWYLGHISLPQLCLWSLPAVVLRYLCRIFWELFDSCLASYASRITSARCSTMSCWCRYISRIGSYGSFLLKVFLERRYLVELSKSNLFWM